MGDYLISIIIPTRNRQMYAVKTVRQICNLHCNLQVIVQDNSDADSLRHMIKDLIESNQVVYSYDSKPLPFSENYNRAVLQAKGKYLCAVGDDDGVLPNIVECAKWMEREGIDAIKPAKDLVFFHPGNKNKKENACVGFNQYSGRYRFSNPESAVINLLNEGGCNYLTMDLVGSYHGLVSMEIMEKVRKITGVYYGGLTPDMYSVICLSLVPGIKFAVVDYPITLPGVCPYSGSAASGAGKHVGKLEEAPHLKYLPDYQWDRRVPTYYSVETIWAETMIKAVQDMKRGDLIDKFFNRYALSFFLYRNNSQKREDIIDILEPDLKNYVLETFRPETKRQKYYTIANKAITRITGKRVVYRHIDTIEKAVAIVMEHLQTNNSLAPWNFNLKE